MAIEKLGPEMYSKDPIKPVPNNVFDYFISSFGEEPSDDTLKELSITDPCGETCKASIDAIRQVLELKYSDDDGDEFEVFDPSVRSNLVEVANENVMILWRG